MVGIIIILSVLYFNQYSSSHQMRKEKNNKLIFSRGNEHRFSGGSRDAVSIFTGTIPRRRHSQKKKKHFKYFSFYNWFQSLNLQNSYSKHILQVKNICEVRSNGTCSQTQRALYKHDEIVPHRVRYILHSVTERKFLVNKRYLNRRHSGEHELQLSGIKALALQCWNFALHSVQHIKV